MCVYFVALMLHEITIMLTLPPSDRLEWAAMKTLLGDPSMMKRLLEVEKDSLSDATLRKLKKYTESPKFLPDEVRRTSVAPKRQARFVAAAAAIVKMDVVRRKSCIPVIYRGRICLSFCLFVRLAHKH